MATIKKITRLKKLGVYDDFSWSSGLPDFKRYNVIYGWNGTGKTTLSKLLGALNVGSHPDFDTLEYSVLDGDGATHSQGTAFATPIRVFNSDFISDNVNFETQSSKAITVILGEENKELLEAIEADEKKLAEVKSKIKAKTTELSTKKTARGSEFTGIARTIGQGTQGAIVRNYNKSNAETAFNSLTSKELLDDEELETLSKSVGQETMLKQDKLSLGETSDSLNLAIETAKGLFAKTVEATIIARLKDNPDIAEWVEAGLALHNEHNNDVCDFCSQPITTDRIAEITAHFNEADAKLKADVDDLAESLRHIYDTISKIQPADKMNLYQEFRDDYGAKSTIVTEKRDQLLTSVTDFGKLVKSKKARTTEPLEIGNVPDLKELSEAIASLNSVLTKHNEKTDNFDEKRKTDSQKIERHHLSSIYDKVKTLDGEIETLSGGLTSLTDGIEGDDDNIGETKLVARIAENKAKISSSHKACELLNKSLTKFLGHDEISFAVNDDETGYKILRRGEPAKSLSEGERTAIAFIFFVTQLQDEGFDTETGIVVVDDPVSSLDANSQFQAFSFLKEATKNAGQLFLLTHNFEFLKLVLNWVKNARKDYALFMIKNSFSETDGSRSAYIDKLDKALEVFESEYHYLFNIAYNYKDDGTIENAYKMPNVARKLLDSFLMFRVPKNISPYKRLEEIKYDEEKKTAIYKFTNDQSHITGSGFDPSLVPEAKKVVADLLDMIKTVDPDHYDCLVETVS